MDMKSLFLFFGGSALLLFTFVISVGNAAGEELECLIEPYEEVAFSSQVHGILEEVAVERGDMIKKDQVLARLKSGVEEAAVESARARVEFGKRKALRNEDLYQKKLISIHEKDEIETEIQMAELQLLEALEKLKMRTIRSTIDGIVVERFLAPGEYVGEDPILMAARINPLNVEVIVPVQHIGSIKKGMRAKVRPEKPVGGVYTGKVVIVDSIIDAASGTFGVRVELPNPSLKLPAGLKCHVRFL